MGLMRLFKLGKKELEVRAEDAFIKPTTVIKVDLDELRKQLSEAKNTLANTRGSKDKYELDLKETNEYINKLKKSTAEYLKKNENKTDSKVKRAFDVINQKLENIKAYEAAIQSSDSMIENLTKQVDMLSTKIESMENKERMAKMKTEFTEQVNKFSKVIDNPSVKADISGALDKIDVNYFSSVHKLGAAIETETDIVDSINKDMQDEELEAFKKSLLGEETKTEN